MAQPDIILPEKEARQRLLDSAEQLFAEKGFDSTSVRDLTELAKCNIAAVNYHYGSKENLYQKVFHKHFTLMRETRITGINQVMQNHGSQTTLEQLIEAFARAFLEPLLDDSSGRLTMRLMMREMTDPRLPADMFFEEMVKPVFTVLLGAMQQIFPDLDQRNAQKCVHSLIAQLIHVVQVRSFFTRIQKLDHPMLNLQEMLDHIVQFTAAGMKASLMKGNP